ncbi:MAG: SBBP repeat-containing protein [Candidatus Hodarchaeales archaeon]|jgi:hypothetical protein
MKNKLNLKMWMSSLFIFSLFMNPGFFVNAENTGYVQDTQLDLGFSTYLGGNGKEALPDLVLDSENNIYVTGYSYFDSGSGNDYPTQHGYNLTRSTNPVALFVSKLTPDAQNFLFSTWIGGLGSIKDERFILWQPDLVLDHENNIIVGGTIQESNRFDFPTTNNALNKSINGDTDIFITKLSNDGTSLPYSTILGGSGVEAFRDLTTDASGNIYVTGMTNSPDFPITEGVFDSSFAGPDIFVTKLSPEESGYSIAFSTFLGGTSTEDKSVISVDSSNNVIIAGATISDDFPLTNDAINSTYYAPYTSCTHVYPYFGVFPCGNMFISKLSSDGSELLYSTYIGGKHEEYPTGIVIDSLDNIIVSGTTRSVDFPITENANKSVIEDHDVFVIKLSADGSEYLYSTFIGGSKAEYGFGVDLDGEDNIISTGWTGSDDFLKTQDPIGPSESFNTFIFRVSSNGIVLNSLILGGGTEDRSFIVRADSKNDLIVIGDTISTDFPTKECFYCVPQGSRDLVLFKVINPDSISDGSTANSSFEFILLALVIIPFVYSYKGKKVK